MSVVRNSIEVVVLKAHIEVSKVAGDRIKVSAPCAGDLGHRVDESPSG
jgi:hypothetical protein